jgi:signal transduction histidine kinase
MLVRWFATRSLPAQSLLAGALAALLTAAVAGWADAGGALTAALVGSAGVLAAAWPARRAGRDLATLADAAAQAQREEANDTPADAGAPDLPLLESSAELHRASLRLRRLAQLQHQRQLVLQARVSALGQSLELRTHELSALAELSSGLNSAEEVHVLVDEALGALGQTMDYSSASVWARGEPRGGAGSEAEGTARQGRVELLGYRVTEALRAEIGDAGDGGSATMPALRGMRLSRSNLQRYEQMERDGKALIENRPRQSLLSWLWELVTDDARSSVLYRMTRSWMAVPLKVRDSVLGVLRVDHAEPDHFDAERARLLTAVANQTALALRHAQLQAREREIAVLAERNRIARDLHDAVSQTLFAANVLAGTLSRNTEDASIRAQAATLERLNQGALAEMRLLLFELRPEAFEGVCMAELLGHAIDAFECRSDITVETAVDAADPLPAAKRIHCHRIAQEALSNVARHSGATHVWVGWKVDAGVNGYARLRIADDGTGFDAAQTAAGHFGLLNMQSRCAEIGAGWQLNTGPGQGTEIVIDIPLQGKP